MSEAVQETVTNPTDQNDQQQAQQDQNDQQVPIVVQYVHDGSQAEGQYNQEVQYYPDDQQLAHYEHNSQIDGYGNQHEPRNGHYASNNEPRRPEKTSKQQSRISGKVKWFNAEFGYGFITRDDTHEDVFVHHSGISRMNPKHAMKSLGDGEPVEFNLMASSVTGPEYRPVRGNPYVSYAPRRFDPPRYRDYGAAGDHKDAYLTRTRTPDGSGHSSSNEHFNPQHSKRGRDTRSSYRGRYAYRSMYPNNRGPRFQPQPHPRQEQQQQQQHRYEPEQYQHNNYY